MENKSYAVVIAVLMFLAFVLSATAPLWIEYYGKKANAIICESAGGKYVLNDSDEVRKNSLSVAPMKCINQPSK